MDWKQFFLFKAVFTWPAKIKAEWIDSFASLLCQVGEQNPDTIFHVEEGKRGSVTKQLYAYKQEVRLQCLCSSTFTY